METFVPVGHKTCKACGETKPLDDFGPYKANTKDGRRALCRPCLRARNKQWLKDNPGKQKEYDRRHYDNNKEKCLEYSNNYKKTHREQTRETQRRWNESNPDKIAIYRKRHQHHTIAWRKARPELSCFYSLCRQTLVLQAKPKWLTKEQKQEIADIYKSARTLSEFHEERYHVDHIEPIKGVNEKGEHVSCGLHVPWNLQVLTASENCRKSNKLKTIT